MPRPPLTSDTTTATATTSCPAPQSLPETIIRAYSLQDFIPTFTERLQTSIVSPSAGDVTFSTPHETAINTFSALFSVAAAVRGRPGIPVERYGKDGGSKSRMQGIGEILKDGEGEGGVVSASTGGGGGNGDGGKKVVKCYDEGFTHVKRIYNHIVTKTGEQMDRLLDEVLKAGGDGYVIGCTSGDFRIELEAEEGMVEDEKVISVPARAPKRGGAKKREGTASKLGSAKGSSRSSMGQGRKGGKGKGEEIVEMVSPPLTATAAPSSKASTASSIDHSSSSASSSSAYAEIHLHRFVAISSIPYYKYLDLSSSRLQFSDATSNSSTLPFPTVTFYALRIIQRWLYNPLRIGQVIEEFDGNAHLYLLANCKRQDRNQYPPPLATAKGMIEVARAADYLGITELAEWSGKMLRKMCHGLNKCGGSGCRIMVPYVLDEIYKSGGMGLDEQLSIDIKEFLARNVESMWKRPVVMLNDKCLEELVETFKGLHAGCGVPSTGAGLNMGNKGGKKKKISNGNNREEEDVVTRPLHWWHIYLELNRLRVSVMMSASGHTNRWMEKLLGPTMEHCVHEIARGFNDPRLAADLASKMEDGSFQKDVVEEMLMMVSMSSLFGSSNGNNSSGGHNKAMEVGIPFEKAPLNRRTVKAVFEGIVNLRKFTGDGRDNEEWGKAEKKVLEFLGREWMTIVVGGEGKDGKSGFAGWRPAMLTVLGRKLRVSVDDLLGKGARKGMAMQISAGGRSRGGRMVKDSFGNDVMVDSRELRRTEVDVEVEEEEGGSGGGNGSLRRLRAEAEDFVPTGGAMGVDGASN
ncbi:hypothetical protein TWF506_010301 [Arthrobotrys conoides]|uniref:Uncharacterized protein n=1 Tax=Arthrobotrys conoides TaxID=74498 RepID=A0AAN8RPI5_9PEZI